MDRMRSVGTSGREHELADAGQRAAFADLVDHHLDRAYRLAGVILGDALDAEDATHDAVVVAWRHYGSLRDPARFEAWFQRILVNACRDRLRRRRRSPVVEIDATNEHAAAPVDFGNVDDRLSLDRAFATLNPD